MLKPVGMCIYIILNALRVRVKSGEIIKKDRGFTCVVYLESTCIAGAFFLIAILFLPISARIIIFVSA